MHHLYLISVFAVAIFANLVAIAVLPTLSYFMVPPRFHESWQVVIADSTFDMGANTIPFAFILSAIIFYLWPVFRQSYKKKDLAQISTKAKTRLLNAPLMISFLVLLGWCGASVFVEIYLIYFDVPRTLFFEVQVLLISLVLASLTFVLSYYALELLNRRFFIPYILPTATRNDFQAVIRISVRQKLYIFLFTVFVLPITVLLSLVINLNDKGENVYGSDIIFSVCALLTVFFLLSFLITLMKAQSIQAPLIKMQKMSKQIEKGNYNTHLALDSDDELGFLADSMNQMAVGLLEREKMRDVFGKMVDPKVRDHLMKGELNLGGELREVTILFSDIKNFTTFSEKRTPDEIVTILNRYFNKMAACITAEGGVINKFIGDAIMAVFGAPVALENHADAAYLAGLAMLQEQEKLKKEFGTTALLSRIGIHTGQVLAGNIGSLDRMEYTVIGDAVNTASRLESLCKKTEYDLLVSSNTVRLVQDDSLVQYMGEFQVKGKSDLIEVYGYAT